MFKKLSIIALIILQILFAPFLGRSAVWAIPTPPSAPEAPNNPPQPPAPPTAPEPPSQPSAPTPPSQPSAPSEPSTPSSNNNNNNQASNNQASPPGTPSNAPTPPSQPSNLANNSNTSNGSNSSNSPANQAQTSNNESNNEPSNPAPATTQTAANNTTGADSNNASNNNSTSQTGVNTNNQAEVNNDIVAVSSSGGNHSNKNTGDASVTSGDATIQGQIVNNTNTTQTTVPGHGCGSCGGSSQTSGNTNTGAGSSNQANNNVTSDTLIQNNNTANLDTGVIAIADSGHNSANKNTGNGEVITGDANVGLTVVNVANTDITGVKTSEFNVYDDHNGDILIDPWNQDSSSSSGSSNGDASQSAANDTTGADSSNDASNNSNTSLTIINNNDAKVANDLVIDATTGHNDASKNTGDGTITTGDVNVVANVVNLVNNTIVAGTEIWVATVNIFGDLVGDIILAPIAGCTDCGNSSQTAGNNTTGADSSNDSSVAQQRITNINQNNESDIRSSMVINANTGGNTTDKNTGSSETQTGEVNVQAEQYTVANTNAVGTGEQTWWIVIVNEAGRWVGKIFGSPDGQNVASAGQVDLGAANDTTGADSSNQASSSQTTTTDITQNNVAEVDNNLVINADTGHNIAEKNTGNSSVTTGDVNVMSNVVNYVNNNIVGGNVVVAFVNVFGSWLGNILPPGITGDDHSNDTASANGSASQATSSNESTSANTNSSNPSTTPTPTPLAIGGPVANQELTDDSDDSYIPQVTGPRRPRRLLAGASYNQTLGLQTTKEEEVDASLLSVEDRIAQGIWLTEDDQFLQTSPTPTTAPATFSGQVQSRVISGTRGFTDHERWLLILLGIFIPAGIAAYKIKKSFKLSSRTLPAGPDL